MRSFLLVLAACIFAPAIIAQRPTATPEQAKPGDIVTINTELVQTDVTVFDKNGRPVEGLMPDDFVLSIDGKPHAISFAESIRAGSSREAGQLKSIASSGVKAATAGEKLAGVTRAGRVVIFFVDDVHLTNASLTRTRTALSEFIDKRMHEGDQVAVVSTSGQIGFLQQLTNNDVVIHHALERLNYKRNPETYAGRTVITDYQANQVAEHNDRALFNYLVTSTLNEYQLVPTKGGDPRGLSQLAINNVRNRVRQINANSRTTANDTLGVLLSLMRSSAPLPGRKLVFFVSDGFITDTRASNSLSMLKQVTEEASRVGMVVYTMEASGIYYDPAVDASRNDFSDGIGSGVSARNWSAESAGMREPLRILADDTGGRALLNSNSIPGSIQEALDETSAYYLLAWRPDVDQQRAGKSQLSVSIKNHPELRVRLRRNYYIPTTTSSASNSAAAETKTASDQPQPEEELLSTLGTLYPQKTLPASLSVGYVNGPDKSVTLKLSMQVERWAFTFDSSAPEKKEIDVIGAAIDDRGVISTFKQLLTVTRTPPYKFGVPVQWNQELRVPPGLYQVRIALRERNTGRMGGVQQWLEVPDVSNGGLQMSSLFTAERRVTSDSEAPSSLLVNTSQRFARSSALRYQTYLYNAGAAADIEITARIVQDGETMLAMPAAQVPTGIVKDHASLPYWAELPLAGLRPGFYQLQVTATDKRSKARAMQRLHFTVQ
jgi:VWFA-related protein